MTATNWKGLTIAVVTVSALLSGCAGDGDLAPTPTTQPSLMTTTTPAEIPATGAATPVLPAASGQQADLTAGFAAVALAQSEVLGSQAIELGLKADGTWQVEVIMGERKVEFDISADGTQVLGRTEDGADAADIRRLEQAQVTIEEAIRTAMSAVAGRFDEAELDEEQGVIFWEVDLDAVDVHVDAITGEIVTR